ncbi:hypothetical protein V6N13_037835 [Hibiscus sabdariffa]|uniref:Uncharacterized protein n=1 Tax=Hibiscus sabdariffa TaxID=183260 RepID=A0ABR1ZFF7_9ROSI
MASLGFSQESLEREYEAVVTNLLFLAILEADGKRMILEKVREPSDHQVDRNDVVGARDDKVLIANDGAAGVDNSDAGLVVAAQRKTETDSRHHFFPNETNPYFKPRRP